MSSGFEFPDNSHKGKERNPVAPPEPVPEKVVESVTNGKVIRRKTPITKRMSTLFIAGDSDSVMRTVAMEVVLPKVRDLITEAITDYVQKMIYGEQYNGTRRPSSRPSGSSGYTSYTNRYAATQRPSGEAPRAGALSVRDKATHNFDEIILDSRPIADDVLDSLADLIETYEQATVADLYHLVGESSSFVDGKWGWKSVKDARIRSIREGYLLQLPAPVALEK